MFTKHYGKCQVVTISWVHYHPHKSVLKPTQKLTFLGFSLNSKTMTLTLTDAKKEKIIKLGQGTINRQYITIRKLAQFIGNFVGTFEAVLTGPLHYRDMEKLNVTKLKESLMQKLHLTRNLKQKLNGG